MHDRGKPEWDVDFDYETADLVLCDLYVRGTYLEVILPMTILRCLAALPLAAILREGAR